jgi:AraC family transcriptional regulator
LQNSVKLLEDVLLEIEERIKDSLTAACLSKVVNMSAAHLQRLFKFAFEQPIASYIRSRKLASALEDLLRTDLRIIDIANEYGFDYEQTFIRAFKREHGMTPGEIRNSGSMINTISPLQLFRRSRIGNGLCFGPVPIMVPEFKVLGKWHELRICNHQKLAVEAGEKFWLYDRESISDHISNNEYIALVKADSQDFRHWFTSVRVNKSIDMPHEMMTETFPTTLCARFRYIGHHHYLGLREDLVNAMYKVVDEYTSNANSENHLNKEFFFYTIDGMIYDGPYCRMDWYMPIIQS